ncbi:MAG: hypothetical protein CVU05_02710 [Bacteroidetes bacterium HGW-Bacteroidetes-21]|nr:MAG: hypothetical protein CVU05_02710 [Bacteroidetes bacterium HGW-Bacteroidetes-21]
MSNQKLTRSIIHLYSKNRLCPVWNWRKEMLIKKTYSGYLGVTQPWIKFYPVRLILAVPIEDNSIGNMWFNCETMIQYFNHLRKESFWKNGKNILAVKVFLLSLCFSTKTLRK